MTLSGPRSQTLEFIKAGQNPDGGWGYRPGGTSLVEPSAFSALALFAGGQPDPARRGLAFLKRCQSASGSLGLSPADRAGNWMAYAALLAFHAFGARDEERRLADWALTFADASGRFTAADLEAIAKTYRYDASITGWPWTAGTTAWVEPTALFVIALVRTGVSAGNARIASGLKLIIDRRVPSGGWNFGNPFMKSFELPASPLATSLALAALAAADYPQDHPAVGAGLRFLESSLAGDASVVSLAWAVIALRSYPSKDRIVPALSDRLDGLRRPDGSFRRNFFGSALAFLALEHVSLVLSPSGGAA
jgi:hypothetical protein